MLPEEIARYKAYHQKRMNRRQNALEDLRQRVLSALPQAAGILYRLGAERVIAYGSTIRSGPRFHEGSDLDLLVFGLPLGNWLAALLALEEMEELKDVEIDLKRAEELPAAILKAIEENGMGL